MRSYVKSVVGDKQLVEKRRAQLVQAAIALFSRDGYHAATVKDIAEEMRQRPDRGDVATYIPELANVDSQRFGIAIVDAQGEQIALHRTWLVERGAGLQRDVGVAAFH